MMPYIPISVKNLIRSMCVLVAVCFLFSGDASAGEKKKVKWVKSKTGIKSLMTLAKDRGKMSKEYKKEALNYNKLKEAIDGGKIEEGLDSSSVAKKYGGPVIILASEEEGTEEWLYKPDEGWFIDDIHKISLIFDKSGSLRSWEEIAPDPDKKDLPSLLKMLFQGWSKKDNSAAEDAAIEVDTSAITGTVAQQVPAQ